MGMILRIASSRIVGQGDIAVSYTHLDVYKRQHQFIETEKYDAKPTYKKFLGYRPGVAVIDDLIVGIENSDGNTNVRFHQKDTLKRFFARFEQNRLTINSFRADCGSCSEEIVEEIEKHCKSFYIRANRCRSIYNDTFAPVSYTHLDVYKRQQYPLTPQCDLRQYTISFP